ncbi:MAG: hypothetical protein ACL93V_08665 [Candidatus Electrothrix sp. YB6]
MDRYFTIILLMLFLCTASVAIGKENKQFSGAFLIDQTVKANDFTGKSVSDAGVAQGGNVVTGMAIAGVGQNAILDGDLELKMKKGERNTQGLNVVSGKVTALVGQIGVVDEDAALKSVGNEKSAQGINVVNACEGCQ